MQTYDWIVIGAGITGASLSYELTQQGFSVLLLDADPDPPSATRFSYGGIAYWSGTTDLTRQLCAESKAIYQTLSAELGADTEFREIDLLLSISPESNPEALIQNYSHFADPPKFLTVEAACEREPLLDPNGIAGALTVKHGHIDAGKTARAYIEAMQRSTGVYKIATVKTLISGGVSTSDGDFFAANTVVCIGALTRQFLKDAGLLIAQYFTHAEIIEIPRSELRLNTLVMPAEAERFKLEAEATRDDRVWDQPGQEPAPAILDAGAVQFLDSRILIGQVSRTLTDPNAAIDAVQSEADLRTKISQVMPKVGELKGTWQHCLIAFSRDRLPLVGAVPGAEGLYVFSGFSNPLALVPPLARRFAIQATCDRDPLLQQVLPERFI
ncbi:NAD(P)/FAD-dependent oxidoreductase [Leptolyngbya sp. NIES-2104]|uniref:NAD(P)/FAD-dependent oxidoreductase n=1 Tax=Leptolyngbya sp. NIES-2104 TaxID=1552121 RepID=UPI0006EC8F51|nr:FAD-binding oxidoreductase [Leptolyngbya sp. NIES-2104]GAP97362.1 sarcosine oxidase, subunit beta [Leptolyngbya sp. NIES-2104]